MSMLPSDFQFSQNNLQDYADCQRRFQLRHLQHLMWPAVEVEPIFDKENFMKQGALFHRLVHQFLMGLPADKLVPPNADPELRLWWDNFQARGLKDLPEKRFPERLLSIQLEGHTLVSRYDLIAVEAGQRAVIVDWKTTRQRPKKHWLEKRLQTRIYRYLLVRAGAGFNNGQPFTPEQVEMVYWFTNFPDEPERLPYTRSQFQDDELFLSQWFGTIAAQNEFPLTDELRQCRFCTYRSLCERGEGAGTMDEADALTGFLEDDLDTGSITELEF
jgi:PD-(D/E)XK nuclease superfamily